MRATGLLLTLTALLLLLPALPDLLQPLRLQDQSRSRLASTGPDPSSPLRDPALRPKALLADGLLERLEEADRDWIPQAEPLPDGGTRYLYRRRPGEPELTIPQIRALMARPPSHRSERQAIIDLLTALDEVGAGAGLIDPIKQGAAAEWDPQARTLRIRPDVPDQGTLELARVLNHEAIHVAQSCAAGGIGANPRPLGINPGSAATPASKSRLVSGAPTGRAVASPAIHQLNSPVYANLTPLERRMEQEAYALQNRLGVGLRLIRLHCFDGRA